MNYFYRSHFTASILCLTLLVYFVVYFWVDVAWLYSIHMPSPRMLFTIYLTSNQLPQPNIVWRARLPSIAGCVTYKQYNQQLNFHICKVYKNLAIKWYVKIVYYNSTYNRLTRSNDCTGNLFAFIFKRKKLEGKACLLPKLIYKLLIPSINTACW